MKTYLVTGAAGFIGANYIKYILAKHNDIKVVILDALTYAGNLGTIAKDIDNERCVFIKGDICSRDVVDGLFAEYRFDYVVNFAAESHVDRSIENPQLFLITNILGTQNLLDCARRAWVMGKDEQGRYNFIDTGRFIMSKEFIEQKSISIDKSFDEDKAFEIYESVKRNTMKRSIKSKGKER